MTKNREPKLHPKTIRGVRLNGYQHAAYRLNLERRSVTNHGDNWDRIEELALSDTLHPYKASTRAKGELMAAFNQLSNAALGCGALSEWLLGNPQIGALQLPVLAGLIEQVNESSKELRRLHRELRAEHTTAKRNGAL